MFKKLGQKTTLFVLIGVTLCLIAACYFFTRPDFKSSLPYSLSQTDSLTLGGKVDTAANPREERKLEPAPPGSQATPLQKATFKIIKTGNIRYQVKDYRTSRAAIERATQRFGGYISVENEQNNNGAIENSISIRVPADRFDGLAAALLRESIYLEYKNIEVKDVTAEFIDSEARLMTKRQVELRFMAILKQARTVKDTLEVESQLGAIREDIEATEGKLKYLTNQIIFSTITLSFYQRIEAKAQPENSFWHRVKTAFITGWQAIVAVSIGLIYLWPFILLACAVWVIILKLQKRKGNSVSGTGI